MPPEVVLDPNTRAPSSPLAKFLRVTIIVPASTFLAGWLTGHGLTVESAVVGTFLTGIVNALGTYLRDKGYSWAIF